LSRRKVGLNTAPRYVAISSSFRSTAETVQHTCGLTHAVDSY
jgi:hypothetical protein